MESNSRFSKFSCGCPRTKHPAPYFQSYSVQAMVTKLVKTFGKLLQDTLDFQIKRRHLNTQNHTSPWSRSQPNQQSHPHPPLKKLKHTPLPNKQPHTSSNYIKNTTIRSPKEFPIAYSRGHLIAYSRSPKYFIGL